MSCGDPDLWIPPCVKYHCYQTCVFAGSRNPFNSNSVLFLSVGGSLCNLNAFLLKVRRVKRQELFLKPICLWRCEIASVCLSALGMQKICWEIKLWAVFSFAWAIKPSATSSPTSETNQICWTSLKYIFTAFICLPMLFFQRGYDRCRHFVITQNQDGLFVVSGDCQTHRSLTELIEHYKSSPIQPFGECLTSCCYEVREAGQDVWDQRQGNWLTAMLVKHIGASTEIHLLCTEMQI